MGFFDFIFGKRPAPVQRANGFNDPTLAKRPEREVTPASILFSDAHEPIWLTEGKPVPDPIPEPSYLGTTPPELPPAIRQKVGRVLETRFQMSPESAKLIALLNDPDIDPGKVTQAVSMDQNLLARILKTVNSAQFGLAQPITAVGRAIVLLGFNNIRALALADAVARKSNVSSDNARVRQLWIHSAITSACATSLSRKIPGVDQGEAATAGLLVNIGKMLMKVEEVGILSAQTGLPPNIIEGYVASCFAETWGLPAQTGKVLEMSSIPFYFPPEVIPVEYRTLAMVVSFSSFVTSWYGFANGDALDIPAKPFLDSVQWKPNKHYWLDTSTAHEMDKARIAMLSYLS